MAAQQDHFITPKYFHIGTCSLKSGVSKKFFVRLSDSFIFATKFSNCWKVPQNGPKVPRETSGTFREANHPEIRGSYEIWATLTVSGACFGCRCLARLCSEGVGAPTSGNSFMISANPGLCWIGFTLLRLLLFYKTDKVYYNLKFLFLIDWFL